MKKVYVGVVGYKIILNVVIDISGASVRKISYRKPDGTTGQWTAAEESTTSISYTTTAITDLDQAGIWSLQSYVVKTWKIPGKQYKLEVEEPLVEIT